MALEPPIPAPTPTPALSFPPCSCQQLEHLPLPSHHAPAPTAVGSSIGWAPGAGDAVLSARAPPGQLSAQYYGQPAAPVLLEQLAALHSAASLGVTPGTLPAPDARLQGTAASRLLGTGGRGAHAHPASAALARAPRLPYYAGSLEDSLDSAGSSLAAAFLSSEGSSPSRCSLEAGEADAGSDQEGPPDPRHHLLGLQQLGLGSPTRGDPPMQGQ